MATYSKRVLQDGTINYCIQTYIRDANGKRIYKCTTYKNEDNLSGKKLDKALHAFGEAWEERIKTGKNNKYEDYTFNQMADLWLDTRKDNMSKNYYVRASECLVKLKAFFGNTKFSDIRAIHVQDFFRELSKYEFTTKKARIKPNKLDYVNNIILKYGLRKADKDGETTRATLYYARKGEVINYESAVIICKKFGFRLNETFDIIEETHRYKKETILKYQRVLSAIFAYAIRSELVKTNYAAKYYTKDSIGGEKAKEIPILDNSEYDRLIETLNNDNDLFHTIPIYLLATLGLRTCEVCGLQWRDINFDKKTVSIKRDRTYVNKEFGCQVDDTKTKYSKRTLTMCDLLLDKLKEFKSIYDELKNGDKEFDATNDGFIFCDIKGQPVFPHHLNEILKKYLMMADCKIVSCHKIRHSWITRLISNGAPVNIVSKLAGHAGIDTTLKLYAHYYGELDNSLEMLNEIFISQK
ncbi:MAG: site-specific integrase [Christensenellales bacterium]